MKKLISLVLAITVRVAIGQNNLSPQMVNTAGGSGLVAGTYYDYTVGEPITLFGGIPSGCDSIFSGFQHCAIDTLRTNVATVAVSGATTFCLTQSVTLTAPAGVSWLWSNGATTQTISVGTAGNYHVRTTNSCGDTIGSNNVVVTTINPQIPAICMVSTDSVTNYKYNIVYWDNIYQHVDSFIVYRAISTTAYVRIGAVSKDSLSEFIDIDSTIGSPPHGGNPTYNSWKYKIAIRDTCGNIGTLSPYHQTMFIQESGQNFSWSAYVDSGQVSLPSSYTFLRDDNNTGAWHVLSSGITTTSCTDPAYASYPNGNWRVDAEGFNCTPSALRLANSNNSVDATRVKSHSNTQRVAGETTGIKQVSVNTQEVIVYPNPSNGTFNIQLSNYDNATVEVYDAIGNKVFVQALQTNISQLDISSYANGMYQLRVLKNNTSVYQTKISKVD